MFVALTVGAAVYAVRSGQPTGRFLGLPYDFRVPTADRLRERLWNEDDERIFTPMVFGVGWSINLFRLVEKFQADNAVEENARKPPTFPPPLARSLNPPRRPQVVARWCSGSTKDFGSSDPGSNPGRAATKPVQLAYTVRAGLAGLG